MTKRFELIVLIEDTVHEMGLMSEHGLSFWINYGPDSFIFDTGQGLVINHNMTEMDLDISNVSAVILSHGHYDHTGGLSHILSAVPEMDIYAHSRIFNNKYVQKNKEKRGTGINVSRDSITGFKPVEGISQLKDGVFIINGVERTNDFEIINQNYKVELDTGVEVDDFKEEISLLIKTEKGPVVLTGCSHQGIVNILEYIKKNTDIDQFHAVIGGFHLINAEQERIEKTVNYLNSLDLEFLVPIHCTGFNAVRAMANAMSRKVKILYSGESIKI